ncbi:phosphoglyceromutase [Flavivirga sp. 57AJ16]|uniref:phosphoglyceromutase n=1 Tax=Flavivirga sp. 57AJ16 TaxID=3025307 RepID=UPI0023656279|nr:phosphoglyceromutase [Flavivirga sp. 57AJ16]MDD7886953.1 phosphoglyceromutase [Flavivirga sp. 57AJ16]
MKKSFLLLISFFVVLLVSCEKKNKDERPNVFLITLDGVRWQEVFKGIDTALINSDYSENKKLLNEKFVGNSMEENRTLLMPFFWDTISKKGKVYGNRNKNSKVNLTNKMAFSYPGYNEILTGYADDENINSNDKIYNKNVTILEKANETEAYKGKVAAFCSWDVFPYIINDKRSGIPVNAGFMNATGDLSQKEIFLNEIQQQAPILWESVRFDLFTHHYAKEYVKKKHPKLVFISYGETDDFAHQGRFDNYIKSLNNTDSLIADLWDFVQNDNYYKDNTYFILATDHGRGKGIKEGALWTDHGWGSAEGDDQAWIAILGPHLKEFGEEKNGQFFTSQIAPTIAKILGIEDKDSKMGVPLRL